MLRTTSPNISIITNFGCKANCWYCIWKGHELQYINDPTNWQKLTQFLQQYKDKGKVSVSGGGDCLYKYDRHVGWWNNLFDTTADLNMKVDVHTREKFLVTGFWQAINRCVFSSDNLKDDIGYLRWLSQHVKLRITHLITAATDFSLIDEYLKFQTEVGCQFTIKELVGYDDTGNYQRIRECYPEIYHLDTGDYNIYYMPDNTVRTSFLLDVVQ